VSARRVGGAGRPLGALGVITVGVTRSSSVRGVLAGVRLSITNVLTRARPAVGFTWAIAVAGALAGCAVGQAGGAPGGDRRQTVAARPTATRIQAVAASCAALTPADQFTGARLVFDGRMLKGPTTRLVGRRVLRSPARVRVIRYLKGRGPAVVRVETGTTTARGGIVVNEDGIQPAAGQRWRIYSSASRQPFTTSLCAGSRMLRPRRG
jgi:hypothetical protein